MPLYAYIFYQPSIGMLYHYVYAIVGIWLILSSIVCITLPVDQFRFDYPALQNLFTVVTQVIRTTYFRISAYLLIKFETSENINLQMQKIFVLDNVLQSYNCNETKDCKILSKLVTYKLLEPIRLNI